MVRADGNEYIEYRGRNADLKVSDVDDIEETDIIIFEILMKRRGWRAKLTEQVPKSKIRLLAIIPLEENNTITTQIIGHITRGRLEQFLSELESVYYELYAIEEDVFLVLTKEQHYKYYTLEFVRAGAHLLLMPTIENGISRWLLVAKDPDRLLSILCNNAEALLTRRISSSKIADIIKEHIKKEEIFLGSPKLTFRQKLVLECSLKTGLYEYPKRVRIKDISEMLRLPPSTICYNIRTAERKILQWFTTHVRE